MVCVEGVLAVTAVEPFDVFVRRVCPDFAHFILAELQEVERERNRYRETLERIAKSNADLPPASRFLTIARAALKGERER